MGSRTFSLSAAALLVCAAAGVAAAKPSIAILGLEVVDKTGSPSNDDVNFAKTLTEDLRSRAKVGGPYTLANGGDKELIDLKLLKGCDGEAINCMASIGGDLGADFLMYGSVTKRGSNYDVVIQILDVHAKKKEHVSPSNVATATGGVALQNFAKKVYNGLTGQADGCTITVKTPGVDRGTIQIGTADRGNITAGTGQILGLSEGKYSISVESPGFHRWTKGEVACTAGENTTVTADLSKDKSDKGSPPVLGPGDTGAGTGSGSELTGTQNLGNGSGSSSGMSGSESHSSNKALWKTMAYGGLVGAAVGGGIWVYGYSKISNGYDPTNLDVSGATDKTVKNYGLSKCGTADGNNVAGVSGNTANTTFKSSCAGNSLTKLGIPLTVGFGVISAIGFVVLYMKNGDEEKPVSVAGRRKHHEPFAVTPVLSPSGAGATFRMEW